MSQRGKGNPRSNKGNRSSGNRGRGKGNFTKTSAQRAPRFGADEMKDGGFTSARNDWRWYATNEQLVKDAASYPFGYALGSKVYYGPYGVDASKWAIPGICVINWMPTVGYSNHTNSPINIASRKIFTDMRRNNAGATNYDPVDMMIYLASMDSAYYMLEAYKRIYGLARSVSPVNRYYPRAIIESLGVDYDDLISNLDDFRAMINTYVQKLKCLVIPNGMSYMAKHQWLCAGVYQDRPTDKSQLYLFNPYGYYVFGLDKTGAGMLKGVAWTGGTFAQLKTALDNIVNPILANQDFAIMSGDILKWRGEGGVVVPTGITDTYQVFAAYDESVLDQIQNLTIVGEPQFYTSSAAFDPTAINALENMVVCQDPNKEFLLHTPAFSHPWAFASGTSPNPGRNVMMSRRLINFQHDNVQAEEVMEATRLTNIGRYLRTTSSGKDRFDFPTMGSEVVINIEIGCYKEKNDGTWDMNWWPIRSTSDVFVLELDSTGLNSGDFTFIASELENAFREVDLLSNFNRHPYIAFSAGLNDEAHVLSAVYSPWTGYSGDIDYYTVLDDQDLTQMSEVALLSEFNVRSES